MIIPSILLVFSLITSPLQSQVFTLWADEERSTNEVYANPYTGFDVYVFLEPLEDGARTAEYKMIGPEGHFMPGAPIFNPVVHLYMGVAFGSPGIVYEFSACQNDILWIVCARMMAQTPNPGIYELLPNDDSQFMGVTLCRGPIPQADAIAGNVLLFNMKIASGNSSWGAIKAIYRR